MKRMNKILLGIVCGICIVVGVICALNMYHPKNDYPSVNKIVLNRDVKKDTPTETSAEGKHTSKTTGIFDPVRIINLKLVRKGDYDYFTATLRNNTDDTLTYIKYNIFLFDEDGNIIQSEWSNWSGKLPPKSSTPIETMFKSLPDTKTFKVQIENYKFN